MTTHYRKLGPMLILGMAAGFAMQPLAISADAASAGGQDDPTRAPFGADEFWRKIEVLLNKQRGSITKELFQSVFAVEFEPARTASDATTYLLHAGANWYFDARLTVYNDKFRFQGAENGAHSQWTITWRPESFGAEKESCLRADRVRASLLATGWSSPWGRWGQWEEPAKGVQSTGPYPPLAPEPRAQLRLQTDEAAGNRDRLPQGRVFATGDLADSCVTGILVTARP
jgi:hypothetical protein